MHCRYILLASFVRTLRKRKGEQEIVAAVFFVSFLGQSASIERVNKKQINSDHGWARLVEEMRSRATFLFIKNLNIL